MRAGDEIIVDGFVINLDSTFFYRLKYSFRS